MSERETWAAITGEHDEIDGGATVLTYAGHPGHDPPRHQRRPARGFGHYSDGWNALSHPFGVYLMNSAIVVLGALLGNLVSCSMAAYAFARLQFRGRPFFFGMMMLTLMVPIYVLIIPQYVMFSKIEWVCGRHQRSLMGLAVRDVRRHADPGLHRLPRGPALPRQGNRRHRNEVALA
ncbi:hypothetical protein [Streptomyces vastus]|uniref:hypothetical protein n=1 Tax=Streptomyces vastus TaxID=285451 RepID=UPI0031D4994A